MTAGESGATRASADGHTALDRGHDVHLPPNDGPDASMAMDLPLPSHPRPRSLESLTSYVMFLAQENRIGSISGLKALGIPTGRQGGKRVSDLPPPSLAHMLAMTTRTRDDVLRTTLLHVATKFGRAPAPQAVGQFLVGAIAPTTLRYCPRCVAERGYYRLTWRFLSVVGCPVEGHRCGLLDRCGHCGHRVPLLASPPRIGVCPACGGNLGACAAEALSEGGIRAAQKAMRDAEFLVTPHPAERIPDIAIRLGHELAAARGRGGMSRADVAHALSLSAQQVQRMEGGRGYVGAHSGIGSPLLRYLAYIDYLGVALPDLFAAALQAHAASPRGGGGHNEGSPVRSMADATTGDPASDGDVACDELRLARAAASRIEAAGEAATPEAIVAALGISRYRLEKIRPVREFFNLLRQDRYIARRAVRTSAREAELVTAVGEARLQLSARGEAETLAAVCRLVGVSLPTLRYYPRVDAILREITAAAGRPPPRREGASEDDALDRLRAAIERRRSAGLSPDQRALLVEIGVSPTQLGRLPRVRAALDTYVRSRVSERMEARARHEADILARAKEILGRIEGDGTGERATTLDTLAEELGMPVGTMMTYEGLRSLWAERGDK